ncbi:hypothetical protein AJ87_13560 [Rhizobium yanglingense]|nr:hypothetical protein AJ87_13560 [Rhizobium yanglingense]
MDSILSCQYETRNALLRSRPFFVAPCAEDHIKPVLIQRWFQALCLGYSRVMDCTGNRIRIYMDDQIHSARLGHIITKVVHFVKLPSRVDRGSGAFAG